MTPLGMQKIILTESIEVGQIGLFLDYSSNLGNGLMNFLPFCGRLSILPVAADLISLDMLVNKKIQKKYLSKKKKTKNMPITHICEN